MPLPKIFSLSLAFVAIACGRTSGDDLANAVTTGWKARSEKTPVVHYVINGEKDIQAKWINTARRSDV